MMHIVNHPSNKLKDIVNVDDIGCVFIGTNDQCQEYVRDNAWKFRGMSKAAAASGEAL